MKQRIALSEDNGTPKLKSIFASERCESPCCPLFTHNTATYDAIAMSARSLNHASHSETASNVPSRL